MNIHKPNLSKNALVFVLLIAFVASTTIAYLNVFDCKALFYNTTGAVADKYAQQATPAGIIFGIIWPIIYIWNFAGIVYLIVSMCLPNYQSPIATGLISYPFLYGYIITSIATMLWLFAFDRELLNLSLILLALSALGMYMAFGSICNRTSADKAKRLDNNMIWAVRVVFQNGLGIYATWTTIATLLGFCDYILYQDSFSEKVPIQKGNLSIENASTLTFLILIVLSLLWFVAENFIFEKAFRYVFSTFPVIIMALSGCIVKLQNTDEAHRNFVIACVEVSIVSALFLTRIGLSVNKFVTSPIKYHNLNKK